MTERELHTSELFTIREFECGPDASAWRDVNVIESEAPLVVFPHVRAVGIRPVDAPPVLATPNHVMFYNPGQRYERRLLDAQGDRCVYIALHPAAVRALDRESLVLRDGRLTATHASASPFAYLGQHRLVRRLRAGDIDPVLADELTLRIVGDALRPRMRVAARRRATEAAHRRLAEAAKELLAASPAEPHSIADIARRLDVSPFHLSRVFRGQTGFTVHRYLTQLRLRLALDRLHESAGALSPLALELGFASHSHFSDTFRRELGVSPSSVLAA